MTDRELALELRVRRLDRQTIARVHYQSVGWAEAPAWSTAAPHSVDLAIALEMESGLRFRIGWTDELGLRHGHGIGLKQIGLLDRDVSAWHDVTDTPAWRGRVGVPIRAATLVWRDIADSIRSSLYTMVCIGADRMARADYPHSIQLDLGDAGSVLVSSARLDPDGQVVGFTNNVLVTFA